MRQEDALSVIVDWLRHPDIALSITRYGYDLYIPSLIRNLYRQSSRPHDPQKEVRSIKLALEIERQIEEKAACQKSE